VFFGAVKAEVLTATSTALTVKVPVGANYQPISVTTNGLISYSKLPFVVTYDNGSSVFERNAFSPKEDFALSYSPNDYQDINSADLDGDGKPDILVTERIFRNTGDPLHPFTSKDSFETFLNGRAKFVDVDGDGKLDAVSFGNNVVEIARNKSTIGNISFEPYIYFPAGDYVSDFEVGDMDGDGKIDLITSNGLSINTVSVLRNISTSTGIKFAPQQDFATGTTPNGVCVIDFDGDGKLDIATSNVNRSISVLRNTSLNGLISFSAKQDYSTDGMTRSIAAGDFDGDGKPDLITSSFSYEGTTYTGAAFKNLSTNGAILFSAKIPYTQSTGNRHVNLKISDLDGDGKPDMVSGDLSEGRIYLLKNNSTSNTLSFSYYSTKEFEGSNYAPEVVVGDWNLDGKPDLAVRNGVKLSILLNQTGLATPEVTKFTPAIGGEDSKITITGNFLDNATSVTFGNIEAKSFKIVSPTSIEAIVAFNRAPVNPQNITVTTPNGTALIEGFTYVRKPVITSYTVSAPAPNYTIVINGFELTGATAVSFGNVPVTSFVVNSINKITATSQFPISGDLSITTPGGTTIYKLADAVPTITSLNVYTAATGEKVELNGTNFDNVTQVNFGGVAAASFTIVSATKITAIVGNGASGNVEVVNANGTAKLAGFTYLPPPAITSFSPTTAGANELVTINGTNLSTVTTVSFGGIAATSFTVVSATKITAIVGSGASGEVEVIAARGAGKLSGFTYLPPPEITSFSPTTASSGDIITITGTNLSTVIAVKLGGIAATSFTVVNATKITAIVGSGASGEVEVIAAKGTSKLSGFTYLPPPAITSFSPTTASANDIVTIIGTNLSTVTAVKFGGIATTSFTIVNATKITAIVGSGASGEVEVITAKGTSKLAGFTYLPPATISLFFPTTAIANEIVTIIGTNFINVTAVSFGGVAATSFTVISPTTITAKTAAGASGEIKVTTLAGTVSKAGFTFLTKPMITDVNPLTGGTGSVVTITGFNLSTITAVTFGGKPAASFTLSSDTTITAVVGDGSSGEILLTNTKRETDSYKDFVFVPKPSIIITGSTTLINNATAKLTASTGKGFNYIWKRDGLVITGKTTDEIEISQKGSYTVSIVNGTYITTSDALIIDAYFALPATNFKIQSFGTSCIGIRDGSFTINAISPQKYTASLSGNGIAKTLTFVNLLEVKQLLFGSYTVCITVDGQPDFKQCFTIVITEPKSLAVYTSVKTTTGQVTLQLTGGTNYTIDLNGTITQTDQSSISLPLKSGTNIIKVTADKLCQGAFEQTILYTSSVLIYPNPFEDMLNIQFPPHFNQRVGVSIFDVQGKVVFKDDFSSTQNTVDLNLSILKPGVYLLKITTAGTETIHKIIKK